MSRPRHFEHFRTHAFVSGARSTKDFRNQQQLTVTFARLPAAANGQSERSARCSHEQRSIEK
jgi:hypothetical protein